MDYDKWTIPIFTSAPNKNHNIISTPEIPLVLPPTCLSPPRGNSYSDLEQYRLVLLVFDLYINGTAVYVQLYTVDSLVSGLFA